MKVVILCGGRGTRLQEETEFRPKPMVPIGDHPILWHIMRYYAHYGHTEFILCLGYKGDCIKDYFRNYLWNTCDVTINLETNTPVFHNRSNGAKWTVTLAETGKDSMTGYRVVQALPYVAPDETFLMTYGDGLSNIDIPSLIADHHKHSRILTLSGVHSQGRFGLLHIDPSTGHVDGFAEKVQEPGYINGGFMVCHNKIGDYIPNDPSSVLEVDTISRLVSGGQVHAYTHEGWWHPMDTVPDMQHLNRLWMEGRAPWKVW